jgi:hypothetical protein
VVEDANEYISSLQIPTPRGSVLYADLIVRQGKENEHVELLKAAQSLRKLLTTAFDRELKKNGEYRDIAVFPASDLTTGHRVLRVALSYSSKISVDAYLKTLGLPYLLSELVPNCFGDIFSSVDLVDILTSPTKSVDDLLALKLQLNLTYRRDIILSILERMKLAFSCGFTEEQIQYRMKLVASDSYGEEMRNLEQLLAQFPSIVNTARSWLQWLSPLHNASFIFEYRSVSELIAKLSTFHPFVKKFFPPELFADEGAVIAVLRGVEKSFEEFFTESYNRIKTHLLVSFICFN